MTASDVLEVLDALEHANVSAWLAGGWGVDALLGETTRRHGDLDVVVDLCSERQARAALYRIGYRTIDERAEAGRWMPLLSVLRDRAGRTVEVLPVSTAQTDGSGGNDTIFARPSAFAEGCLDGRSVRCLSAATQLIVHQGYEPTPSDRHDVARVCERYGLALPAAYRSAAVGP